MSNIWAKDYTGAPFHLFDAAHLITLALITILVLALFFWKHANNQSRQRFRFTLAIILVASDFYWQIWCLAVGKWSIQTTLPLHLCTAMVYFCAAMLISKNYYIYEFCYFIGIGGSVQAILTPDIGIYGFPHLNYFQFFIGHGAIVIATIYMTVIEKYHPTWKSLPRVILSANLYSAAVALINHLLGSNYMFLAGKPKAPSILDSLGNWPWYILFAELIGLVIVIVLYLPFYFKDRRVVANK